MRAGNCLKQEVRCCILECLSRIRVVEYFSPPRALTLSLQVASSVAAKRRHAAGAVLPLARPKHAGNPREYLLFLV